MTSKIQLCRMLRPEQWPQARITKQHRPEGRKGTAVPTPTSLTRNRISRYYAICKSGCEPTFDAAHRGQVMADQDPPSPTPIAVTLYYGLAVLSVMESYSGRLWDMGNSPGGAIFYLCLPTHGEADE